VLATLHSQNACADFYAKYVERPDRARKFLVCVTTLKVSVQTSFSRKAAFGEPFLTGHRNI